MIVRILTRLGLPTESPAICPVRAPPQLELYDSIHSETSSAHSRVPPELEVRTYLCPGALAKCYLGKKPDPQAPFTPKGSFRDRPSSSDSALEPRDHSPRGSLNHLSATISISRVHVVLDAGTVVHPDRVRAPMEGAALFGASLALAGAITARRGAIEQSNFHDYPMTHIYDAPREIVAESDELPAGVSKAGVPPFAPALCNAVFAATGTRVRTLPLSGHDLAW